MTIPDTFDIRNSEKYIMSIRFRPGGLSFSVYNPGETGSFFYRDIDFSYSSRSTYTEQVKEFFFKNDLMTIPYKKVNVIQVSPRYTLVPGEISMDEPSAFYLFNFSRPDNKALAKPIGEKNVQVIFGMDDELYEFCFRTLSNPCFAPHISSLLDYWLSQSQFGLQKHMFVNLHEKMADIVCAVQGKLLFANTFSFVHPDDIIYYMLYVWRQLEMEQLSDNLYMFGVTDVKKPIVEILRNYVHRVSMMEVPSEVFLWGEDTLQTPLDLITLLLCE